MEFQNDNLTVEQIRMLDRHLFLVIQANEKINLTRITDFKQGQLLHLEDSLLGLTSLQKAPEGLYGDIGSGAGFPGIPLAIASGRETVLIESIKKKAHLLEYFIDELDLNNFVRVFSGRTEELAIKSPECFSVLTARAVASLPSLLELASPLLRVKGWFIAYKADIDQQELDQAQRLEDVLGMKLISKQEFFLSDKTTPRSILVFEKTRQPSVQLPRRAGMAQKRPYRKKENL